MRIDLNLLTVFEAVMHERSVTRAAERLRLSQPAVSGALARLRLVMNDQLFVRTGHGLRPTPAAFRLVTPVNEALATLRNAMRPQSDFDCSNSTRVFTLMISDIGEVIYLPRLIDRLRTEAPGVRLVVRRLVRSAMAEEMAFGTVDLGLGNVENCPSSIEGERLFNESFTCMVRRDHPEIGDELTVEAFSSLPHLLVARAASPEAAALISLDGLVARRLKELGIERNVAHSVPDFLAVPFIVASSNLIVTIPCRLAETYRDHGYNRIVKLPFEVPSFPVSQFWYRPSSDDSGIIWLRRIARELFAEPRPDALLAAPKRDICNP